MQNSCSWRKRARTENQKVDAAESASAKPATAASGCMTQATAELGGDVVASMQRAVSVVHHLPPTLVLMFVISCACDSVY